MEEWTLVALWIPVAVNSLLGSSVFAVMNGIRDEQLACPRHLMSILI